MSVEEEAHLLLGGRPANELDRSEGGGGRHRVLRVRHGDRTVVVKCYGRKAGRLRTALRWFGSRFLVGKSSVTPWGRLHTEQAVLRLWKDQGFDVPDLVEASFPELAGTPYLVMEWIPGTTVERFLSDPDVALEHKAEAVARFAPVLWERHRRALALREPRLLFENPTFNHVFLSGERLVHHDFEIVFQRRWGLDLLVRREIAGFVCSMAKAAGEGFPVLARVLAEHYPDREALSRTAAELGRYGGVPLFPGTAPLTMHGRRRARRRRRVDAGAVLARVSADAAG